MFRVVFIPERFRNDMPVTRFRLVFRLLQRGQLPRDAFRHHVPVSEILDGATVQGSDHLSRSTLQASFRLPRLREWDVSRWSLCMPINQPRPIDIYTYRVSMWPLALFVTSRFEQSGGYYCTCEPGWTGPECSIDVDECSSDPCRNGGICIDQQNSYYCQCLAGYTGNHRAVDSQIFFSVFLAFKCFCFSNSTPVSTCFVDLSIVKHWILNCSKNVQDNRYFLSLIVPWSNL